MVTPTNGTLSFRGKSGQLYTVDAYISDVVNAAVTFNVGGGSAVAGSLPYWIPPEDVVLEDAAIHTGPTVAVGFYLTRNGTVAGASNIRLTTVLDTLNNRPKFAVPFLRNTQVGATQF